MTLKYCLEPTNVSQTTTNLMTSDLCKILRVDITKEFIRKISSKIDVLGSKFEPVYMFSSTVSAMNFTPPEDNDVLLDKCFTEHPVPTKGLYHRFDRSREDGNV